MNGSFMDNALAAAAMRLLELRLTKTVTVNNPAAGQDWSVTVPGGCIWELLLIRAIYTPSAVVATRRPNLLISDGNALLWRFNDQSTFAAGSSGSIVFFAGAGASFTASADHGQPLPVPFMNLDNGSVISTSTVNMDVGDQWSGIVLRVRQWDETDVLQELLELGQQFNSLVSPEVIGRMTR